MDGQVGVESTGVCGPVRAEAGDWHTAHATWGLNADAPDSGVDPRPSAGKWRRSQQHVGNTHAGAFVPWRSWKPPAVCENTTIREHLVVQDMSFLLDYCLLWMLCVRSLSFSHVAQQQFVKWLAEVVFLKKNITTSRKHFCDQIFFRWERMKPILFLKTDLAVQFLIYICIYNFLYF